MRHWKLGFLLIVVAALFIGAGAAGRSALWTSPEGDVQAAQVPQPLAVAFADTQPTADADADNGPGCAEAALSR